MTTATQQDWAELGRQAFAAGLPCIPGADQHVLDAITGLPVGAGAATIMQQWTNGWTQANLATVVDLGDGPVDGADQCPDGCDPADLRTLNRFEDECSRCGRTGPADQLND